MVDLLLPRHARQTSRAERKTPTKSEKKETVSTSRLLSKPSLDGLLTGGVSKRLKGANDYLQSWKDGLTVEQRDKARTVEQRKQVLALRMKDAESLKDWQAAAEELDTLEGNDEWKRDDNDGNYNAPLLRERLKALEDARANCDIRTMMHLIRTDLSRDLGGVNNVNLYRHSHVGTKSLIEKYVNSAVQTIDSVVMQSAVNKEIECRDLLEGMLLARQSFGRSALLLSGGGTFGMSHIGVLKALFEAHLLPRIISGASAGSIVCAVMCTRTDEEIPSLISEFPYGDLGVFGAATKDSTTLDHMRRLLTEGSWSDIRHLKQVMRDLTGDMTFQEAYNRTRRILNICVSTESVYELPRLLNYVTAPNVMIWSAVAASCSVPLIFHSSPLLVKDPATGEHHPWNPSPQHFIDGSVDNDLPMTRLSEMFNVNHFIVSQVNPHVVPFLARDEYVPPAVRNGKISHANGDEVDWINTFTSLAKDEALHRLQFMAEMGIMPNLMTKLQSILSQKYSGDITILPDIDMYDLPRLLSNPTPEFMLKSLSIGQRATWPRLSRIRDRCSTELALDRAVHHLRARVVFSQSQRDLRKLSTTMGTLRLNQPISLSTHQTELSELAGSMQSQHRRRSGGSLSTMAGHQSIFDGAEITDDETAEDERLEMQARRRQAQSPQSLRKPKLVRASKSHVHVPRHSSAVVAPLATASQPSFNFAKPITPPRGLNIPDIDIFTSTHTSDDEDDARRRNSWVGRSGGGVHVISPIDDQETSELGHSSDADVDQGTEESELEPFDAKWEASPRIQEVDSMFGPDARVGDGLWD